MQHVTVKPPQIPAWNYDGTNWSTIESEAESLGMTIDATVDGTNVTLHQGVLGEIADVPVPVGSWLVQNGQTLLGVMTQEAFDASFEIVV